MWALREGIEEPTWPREPQKGAQAEPGAAALDPLALYLREIRMIPLLTAAEEITPATAIERGRLAGQKLQQPLSRAQRASMLGEKEEGEAARRKMIEGNLRLVVSIAGRYSGRNVPHSDLVEEGNLGLMRAVEKYDHRRGYRFSTYATWWIRQAISRALAKQSRVVRLPLHVLEVVSDVSKVAYKLSQELGRDPTSEEIAAEMHVTAKRVREVVTASQHPVSIDQPRGRGGEGALAELVEDKGTSDPLEQVLTRMLGEQVRTALRGLSARERRVISLRYGLGIGRYHTLEEVGKALGLTRERIRQIEGEALQKLRRQSCLGPLRALAD